MSGSIIESGVATAETPSATEIKTGPPALSPRSEQLLAMERRFKEKTGRVLCDICYHPACREEGNEETCEQTATLMRRIPHDKKMAKLEVFLARK